MLGTGQWCSEMRQLLTNNTRFGKCTNRSEFSKIYCSYSCKLDTIGNSKIWYFRILYFIPEFFSSWTNPNLYESRVSPIFWEQFQWYIFLLQRLGEMNLRSHCFFVSIGIRSGIYISRCLEKILIYLRGSVRLLEAYYLEFLFFWRKVRGHK